MNQGHSPTQYTHFWTMAPSVSLSIFSISSKQHFSIYTYVNIFNFNFINNNNNTEEIINYTNKKEKANKLHLFYYQCSSLQFCQLKLCTLFNCYSSPNYFIENFPLALTNLTIMHGKTFSFNHFPQSLQ